MIVRSVDRQIWDFCNERQKDLKKILSGIVANRDEKGFKNFVKGKEAAFQEIQNYMMAKGFKYDD